MKTKQEILAAIAAAWPEAAEAARIQREAYETKIRALRVECGESGGHIFGNPSFSDFAAAITGCKVCVVCGAHDHEIATPDGTPPAVKAH